MAQNRTFQFYGKGLGDTPVTVAASINGTQVFSGAVTTEPGTASPQGVPPLPEVDSTTLAFTVADSALLNTDFAGHYPMTLTVSGGNGIVLSQITSNYFPGNRQVNPNAGSADHYVQCYWGTPVNSENSQDPRSSVTIDGVATVPARIGDTELGAWMWQIPSPATIVHNLNVGIGQVGNVPGNIGNYTPP